MRTKRTPLSSPYMYQRFRGSCCLNIQVTVEVECSFKVCHLFARLHGDTCLHSQGYENF